MRKFRTALLLCLVAMFVCAVPAMALAQYVVAGDGAFLGSWWDGTDASNSLDASNQRIYYNVAPGSYQIKVVKDGADWYGDWFGNNIHFNVTSTSNVTVKLVRAANGGISVTGPGVSMTNSIVIAGNGNADSPAWLNGEYWIARSTVNRQAMTDQSVYTFTYDGVPAGNYEFKLVFNNEMDVNQNGWQHNAGNAYGLQYTEWGTPVSWQENASNINFSLAAASSVSIRVLMDTYQYAIDLGDPAYAVTVNPTTGGTVTADPLVAQEGKTVTLTVTPDTGYELDSLTVTGPDGAITPDANNQFAMPAGNVTVNAAFKLAEGYATVTYRASTTADPARVNTVRIGSSYTLPGNFFAEPSYYDFDRWQVGESQYTAGTVLTITESIVVTPVWKKEPVVVTDIRLTKNPTKTTYYEGDNFDPAGMEFTVYYSDGTRAPYRGYLDLRQSCYNLTYGQKVVGVHCSEGGRTFIFSINVTVYRRTHAVAPVITDINDVSCYKDADSAPGMYCSAKAGDRGTLTYQWYKCDNRAGDNPVLIEGATTYRYFPGNSTVGTTYYYCVVTNTNNKVTGNKVATATSNVASYTVYDYTFNFYYPTKNVTITVTEGEYAKMHVETDSASNYVWYCDPGTGWRRCTNLSAYSSYATNPTQTWMTGYRYKCVVTSRVLGKNFTSPIFTLKVVKADPDKVRTPTFTQPAKDTVITVYVGERVTLSAKANNAYRGEWYANYNNGDGWVRRGGQITYDWELHLNVDSLDWDGYRFRNRAYNDYGATYSPTYTLKVLERPAGQKPLPRIIAPTEKQTVTVPQDSDYTLSVSAVNATSYEWFAKVNGQWESVHVSTNNVFSLWNLSIYSDGQQYKCRVSNEHGYVDSPVFTLKITPHPDAPKIISPTKNKIVYVYEGDSVTLNTKVERAVFYRWTVSYDNGNDWYKTNEDQPSITLGPVTMEMDGYVYRMHAFNKLGSVMSPTFTLKVLRPGEPMPDQEDDVPVPPQTGDGAHPATWLALLALSGAAMLIIRRRRA